jgi:hypothetical protein
MGAEAKSDIFDYIEGFYNRTLRYKHLSQLSPHEFEKHRGNANLKKVSLKPAAEHTLCSGPNQITA